MPGYRFLRGAGDLLLIVDIYYKLMGKFNTSLPTASILIPSAAAPTTEHITLAIAAILFEVDPCLINFGENTGEYIVEAECIASKLKRCQSMNQMKTIIDKTLNRYFSKNWGTYNRNTKNSFLFASMVRQIWELKNN